MTDEQQRDKAASINTPYHPSQPFERRTAGGQHRRVETHEEHTRGEHRRQTSMTYISADVCTLSLSLPLSVFMHPRSSPGGRRFPDKQQRTRLEKANGPTLAIPFSSHSIDLLLHLLSLCFLSFSFFPLTLQPSRPALKERQICISHLLSFLRLANPDA